MLVIDLSMSVARAAGPLRHAAAGEVLGGVTS